MRVDYSEIAPYYDKVRITSPEILNFWASKIAHYGSIDKDSKVLDIGCGTGRFSKALAEITGAQVYAIDPSQEMLDKAKKKDKNKNIEWSKGKAEDLPFPDEYFDCVYMTFVFHQIKDRKRAVQEMHRVLKKEGKCLVMTTSYAHIRRSPLYHFPGLSEIDLARFPSLPELKGILGKGGFQDVHYHLDKYHNNVRSVDELLKLVKSKYISTLAILGEEEFEHGYEVFEKKLRERFKDKIEIRHGIYIVSGEK